MVGGVAGRTPPRGHLLAERRQAPSASATRAAHALDEVFPMTDVRNVGVVHALAPAFNWVVDQL